ncbi:MAG: ribose 5-phosphate isomerase B [Lewinellaceae bacterium]|nr:ribose 5-phosphate isomerase B [Lewinellaceae bacterium]
MAAKKIVIGSDHAGFAYKQLLIQQFSANSLEFTDVGAHDESPSDYPDIAEKLALEIQTGRFDKGILICGSGVGVSVAVNKFRGVRAGVCHDTYSAHQGVEHDDMNVLCIGQRIIGIELAMEIVRTFLAAGFSGEERHARRLEKVLRIEQEQMGGV